VFKSFIPIIKEQFKPDFVAVSAGFDAHHADPLGGLNFSLAGYYETGALLRKNFDKIFAVLEGGYNAKWLVKCANSFKDGINGKVLKYKDPSQEIGDAIRKVNEDNLKKLKENLSNYWNLN
jgi:acetoin utilization deacetylase AcuC-like enzyme